MSGGRVLRAELLGQPGSRLFTLLHAPAAPAGCVLIVPPFAEEMNKSRRMMTQLSQSLLEKGYATAYLDLYGTGDSDGELEEATWDRWVADVVLTASWLEHAGYSVTHLVGIRLGCALSAAAAAQLEHRPQVSVFWQPVIEGARMVDQFLRLRVAASMMDQSKKETVKELRERLRRGETIEVAGYRLSGALAAGLDRVRLIETAGDTPASDIHWMEVVSEDKPTSVPTTEALEALRSRGCAVTYHQTVGEPFWTATEIVTAPELLSRTTSVICSARTARVA